MKISDYSSVKIINAGKKIVRAFKFQINFFSLFFIISFLLSYIGFHRTNTFDFF